MIDMKTKYRIVKDKYLGYEVQYKKWYWFYWGQLDFSNTFATIQEAFAFIDDCGKVVWQSDQTEVKETSEPKKPWIVILPIWKYYFIIITCTCIGYWLALLLHK